MDAAAMTDMLWLIVGLAAGTAHFGLLRWNTALYLTGAGLARPLGIQAVRLAATTLLLAFAASHGVLPLLTATAGVLLARLVVVRLVRRMTAQP